MTRDEAAARRGYTAQNYIQAFEEGLGDSYRPVEWFVQENAPIHTVHASREWLEVHGVHTID
jgi:hypothetical protein